MDTIRVDIAYRPIRIAWAFLSNDRIAFREIVRLNYALWGGCYNPIVMVDRPAHAKQIVDLYRPDFVMPVGDSVSGKEFLKLFPHLINPLFPETLFFKGENAGSRARILDVQNMLHHWQDNPEWKAIEAVGIRTFTWEDDDPLADTFLLQRGKYPSVFDTGIDYAAQLSQMTLAIDIALKRNLQIPLEWINNPSLQHLHRLGLRRHHVIRPGWDGEGFYLGNGNDIDDLLCFWNLRAADIRLHFVDVDHINRYGLVIPEYLRHMSQRTAGYNEDSTSVGVWSRNEVTRPAIDNLGIGRFRAFHITDQYAWAGNAIRPPMMHFGSSSALGVVGAPSSKPRVAFSLADKPFSSDMWFHSQHLVASVSLFMIDDDNIFQPPYVPEWNEFLSRRMHWQYDKLRLEPDRLGLVIDVTTDDTFVNSIPSLDVIIKAFDEAGFKAEISSSGLITRQLIARLGGLQGARVFKIPGVRRLLKTHGPRSSFSKKAALALIGGKDPENPRSSFSDYKQLYIEAREHGTDLTPPVVFSYLVEKGLIRIGADLKCSTCNLSSWISLDLLKQKNVCELCGHEFDATRQLVNETLQYRRSGVLGLERNAQGAVPVALLLQQLQTNFGGVTRKSILAPSFDLKPTQSSNLPTCEVDFVVITSGHYPEKVSVVIGECKDSGGVIDAKDVENLRQVAEAFPVSRFILYIAFVKLAPFTQEEVSLIQSLNSPYCERAIILTARELEPYNLYERTNIEFEAKFVSWSPADLARSTAAIYFTP